MHSVLRGNIMFKIKGISRPPIFPDGLKMFTATFQPKVCEPKSNHKYTLFQFSFLHLLIKEDFFFYKIAFTLGFKILIWHASGMFIQICFQSSFSLPLYPLILPLVHLVAGRHPKYAEV